jgi:hypothetical protein
MNDSENMLARTAPTRMIRSDKENPRCTFIVW